MKILVGNSKSIVKSDPGSGFLFIFIITTVLLMSGHSKVFAAGGCDNAETLDPDSDAVQKAIDDYGQVSGLLAAWQAAGKQETSSSAQASEIARRIAELIHILFDPLKVVDLAGEIAMSQVTDFHTQDRLRILSKAYNEKMAYEEAPEGNKPKLTTNYKDQAKSDFEAIKNFARNAGCPPDVNFERPDSNENRFFNTWIEEKYRKEKEAREILKKAKDLGLPINLSHLRTPETSYWGYGRNYDRKISNNPYTIRSKQMSWNFDILRSSVEMYKTFEKNFEGRLDEIFEQNGLKKNVLMLCYTQAHDTAIKDYMKKTYELMCQGKGSAEVREFLKKGLSADICKQVGDCLQGYTDYAKKKLDCGEKEPPDITPKDPDKRKSAAPKEKTDLFGDLCRCSCNPGVGGGSGYDPAWGCACTGVLGGKWSAPMVSSGECSISATQAAGLEPGSLGETIKNMNKGWGEKFLHLARDLIEDIWTPLPGLSLGKTGKAGTPETLKNRVERKLDQGDLDIAEGHAKTAVIMYPPLESAAKAVIPGTLPWRLDKLALSFVPSLDFSTSRRILERTIKLDEKNQQVNKSLGQVVQWEKEWNQIKALSEYCFSLLEAKRVCECQRLFDGKIEPLNNSFRIFTGGGEQKVWLKDGISSLTELNYLPIPEKFFLREKLLLQLDNSRRACRYQPGLAEAVGVLEAYIADRARPGRTDQTIADMAKKVLEREGLCDCERELAEKALGIADKWIAEQGPPLEVTLHATKTVMKKGESVELTPTISGGSPPYSFSYIGYWAFDVTGGVIRGQGQTTTSLRAKIVGAHPLDISVTDAKGKKTSGKIVLNVIEDAASTPPGTPSPHPEGVLSRFWVFPHMVTLTVGESQSFKAYGVYSGGDPEKPVNLTGQATWSPGQVFMEEEPGEYTVTATLEGASGSATVTVKAKPDIAGATAATEEVQGTAPGSKAQPTGPGTPGQPQGSYAQPPISARPPAPAPPVTTGTPYPSPPPGYPPGPSDSGSGYGQNWPPGGQGSTWTGGQQQGPSQGTGPGGGKDFGTSTSSPPPPPPPPPPPGTYVMAEITNRSKQNAHIFAEGETFGPGNRFGPGDFRKVNVKVPSNNKITFHAGRNGQVIATKSWDYDPNQPKRIPVVTFNESNPYDKLGIVPGLR